MRSWNSPGRHRQTIRSDDSGPTRSRDDCLAALWVQAVSNALWSFMGTAFRAQLRRAVGCRLHFDILSE
jgi:hypothetical protein